VGAGAKWYLENIYQGIRCQHHATINTSTTHPIYFSDAHLILTLEFKVNIYYLEGQHIIIITNNIYDKNIA